MFQQTTSEQPVRKISRFMVSKVAGPPPADSAPTSQQQSSSTMSEQQRQQQQEDMMTRRAGRFSVTTHQMDETHSE